jgi:hypothetical protein
MSKPIVQNHHVMYANKKHGQKDVEARVYKGEHWLLTNLSRRTHISRGFVISLKLWLALNEHKAVDLDA